MEEPHKRIAYNNIISLSGGERQYSHMPVVKEVGTNFDFRCPSKAEMILFYLQGHTN